MRPPPYISISGVTDCGDILDLLGEDISEPAFMSDATIDETSITRHGHQLAFGVLVSRKTLYGPGNKYPNRYPVIDEAWRAVAPFGALTFIHYSQDTDEHLGSALIDAVNRIEREGRPVHGVQVNVHMPRREELEAFARRHPKKRVVLQLGPKVVNTRTPAETLCSLLLQYGWVVSDVLLDGSAGTGRDMDPVVTAYYVAALDHFAPHLGIGVAGGLCEEKLSGDVERLLQVYRKLSVDAEGGVRDDGPGGGLLVHDKARRYVDRSRRIFNTPPAATAPSA